MPQKLRGADRAGSQRSEARRAYFRENPDIVHIFSTRRADLLRFLVACRSKMKSSAMVWVSWPKKSAKVATEIDEDIIRELALPLGFVDVKVCAVTDVWSGLKLVLRKELR